MERAPPRFADCGNIIYQVHPHF